MANRAGGSRYAEAGVDSNAAGEALRGLVTCVQQTFELRRGAGRPLLPIGHYANVLDLGNGQGLAISTDGVGTKAIVAQLMGKYDTIGIDCVAMNVNDIICVGGEPIAMTDYLAVETADAAIFGELGKGLLEGARQAGISVPGGEVAQIAEMIHGADGHGFDLVGTCVGLVPVERILTGEKMQDGDVLVGLSSSGIHSNGLTLARRVLLDGAGYHVSDRVPDLGRTLGEELLEPTAIYVRFAVAALNAGLSLRALAHITGDGLLNLTRLSDGLGFEIHAWPEIPPVFRLIQDVGKIPDEEMYRVFNMGIGLIAVIGGSDVSAIEALARQHGHAVHVIGHVRSDRGRTVRVLPRGLVGRGSAFSKD